MLEGTLHPINLPHQNHHAAPSQKQKMSKLLKYLFSPPAKPKSLVRNSSEILKPLSRKALKVNASARKHFPKDFFGSMETRSISYEPAIGSAPHSPMPPVGVLRRPQGSTGKSISLEDEGRKTAYFMTVDSYIGDKGEDGNKKGGGFVVDYTRRKMQEKFGKSEKNIELNNLDNFCVTLDNTGKLSQNVLYDNSKREEWLTNTLQKDKIERSNSHYKSVIDIGNGLNNSLLPPLVLPSQNKLPLNSQKYSLPSKPLNIAKGKTRKITILRKVLSLDTKPDLPKVWEQKLANITNATGRKSVSQINPNLFRSEVHSLRNSAKSKLSMAKNPEKPKKLARRPSECDDDIPNVTFGKGLNI